MQQGADVRELLRHWARGEIAARSGLSLVPSNEGLPNLFDLESRGRVNNRV
jgi:hypothetical protein